MAPEGWRSRRIGDFAKRIVRRNDAAQDLPPLSITKDRGVVLQSEKYHKRIATDPAKYQIAEDGDFAFDPMSLYYGAIGRVSGIGRGLVSPDYVTLVVDDSVDPLFLDYLLRWPVMHDRYEAQSETSNSFGKRRRLYWSILQEMVVDVPSLGEQQAVARMLVAVDEAIAATQAVIDQCRRVEDAAVAVLIDDAFGAGDLRAAKDAAPSGRMVGGPFGSDLTANDYVDGGIPVVRGGNIRPGRFVDEGYVYVAPAKAESLAKNTARAGDLVMTQRGASLGEVALIPEGSRFPYYVISQTMMRLRPRVDRAMAAFLVAAMSSPRSRAWLSQHAIGTGQPHLNLSIWQAMPIPLPPLDTQRRIVVQLEAIGAARRSNEAHLAGLQRLKSGLLDDLLTGRVRVPA